MEFLAKKTKEAARFDAVSVPAELRRKFDLTQLAADHPRSAHFRQARQACHLARDHGPRSARPNCCPQTRRQCLISTMSPRSSPLAAATMSWGHLAGLARSDQGLRGPLLATSPWPTKAQGPASPMSAPLWRASTTCRPTTLPPKSAPVAARSRRFTSNCTLLRPHEAARQYGAKGAGDRADPGARAGGNVWSAGLETTSLSSWPAGKGKGGLDVKARLVSKRPRRPTL